MSCRRAAASPGRELRNQRRPTEALPERAKLQVRKRPTNRPQVRAVIKNGDAVRCCRLARPADIRPPSSAAGLVNRVTAIAKGEERCEQPPGAFAIGTAEAAEHEKRRELLVSALHEFDCRQQQLSPARGRPIGS
jgi:hypothetical protein